MAAEPDGIDEWVRFYENGYSLHHIATTHFMQTSERVTAEKVRYWLKKRGVELRPAQQYRRSSYDF